MNYSHFMVATRDPSLLQDEVFLDRNFKELDCFENGFLTKESIQVAF